MKRSFVAMVLILVLCMSQFLIGNAEGKAVDIVDTMYINEGDAANNAYKLEKTEDGVVVKGTSVKTEYACLKAPIDGNAKDYAKILVTVEGTAGTVLKLKLEGGVDAASMETGREGTMGDVTLVDGVQVIEWPVQTEWLTSDGGQSFVVFINPGKTGATDSVTFKSIKLCTADYVEPAVPETPETGDSFNMVPAVMMALAAFVFVVAYAKKRAF